MQISGVRNKMSPFQITAEDIKQIIGDGSKVRKERKRRKPTRLWASAHNGQDNKCKHLTFPCEEKKFP